MVKPIQRMTGAKAYKANPKDLEKLSMENLTKEEVERYTVTSTLQRFAEEMKEELKVIPNYPTEGVTFYDVTPLLLNPYFLSGIATHAGLFIRDIDFVVSPEARGFLFGPTIAAVLGAGFVPMRKKGKVPPYTPTSLVTFESKSEYGTSEFQVNNHTISAMKKIYIKQKEALYKAEQKGQVEEMAADGTPAVQEDTALPLKERKIDVKNMRVIVVDDVLATGNTAASIIAFFESMEIKVTQFISILEIESLEGRKLIESMGVEVNSLLKV